MIRRAAACARVPVLLLTVLAGCAFSDSGYEPAEPLFAGIRPESPTAAIARPRNVIVMIADGAGYNQFKAASYYRGGAWPDPALKDASLSLACATFPEGGSYDSSLAWSDFSYPLSGATDSAAAATAMATGNKTLNGRISTDASGNPLETILEVAEREGKMTGIVTTVPLSHATPAAFGAHAVSRSNTADIAESLFFDSRLDVIMGCGNPERDEDGDPRDGGALYNWIPRETWDALVAGTAANDRDGDGDPDPWILLDDSDRIAALATVPDFAHAAAIPRVHSTLQQRRGGNARAGAYEVPFNDDVPTLAEMALGALNLLSKGPNGFAVMIEGGAIDWAGHKNQGGRMIEETSAFLDAVGSVLAWLEASGVKDDTLVVVVADHETGFLLGDGSGLSFRMIGNNGAGRMPDMEWRITGHTNSLVPFFAWGVNAGHFANDIDGFDSRRGWFIDNTDIGRRIGSMLE